MSKVLKRLYLGDVVKSFGTKQLRKLTTEEPTESIVGTWKFTDTITYPTRAYFVRFTSVNYNNTVTGQQYYGFYSPRDGVLRYLLGTNGVDSYNTAVTGGVWKNNGYPTINITENVVTDIDGVDVTNEFLTWLKANATKQ